MQASQNLRIPKGLDRFYDQPSGLQEVESFQFSDDSSQATNVSARTSDQNCTLESSASGNYFVHHSSSLSPEGSPTSHYGSQLNHLDLLEGSHGDDDLAIRLRELESLMLGSKPDVLDPSDINVLIEGKEITLEAHKWKQLMEKVSRGDLKEILCSCAEAIEENDMLRVDWFVSKLRSMVSVSGDPIQRLAAYMLEGMVARLASSGSLIYKALRCKEPTGPEFLSYMHILYEVCPYFKFGYMSANGAIADAMKSETQIHIVDFQIAQGSQWISLIQALAARPGGLPKVRITGIDDATSAFARGGGLEIVRQRLCTLAESWGVPFEFQAAEVPAQDIEARHLDIRPNEALAVNFPLMLHHIPDESVCPENHRDRLIRLSKSLSPRVVTLVEQESNTNTAPFYSRFVETLNYYLAVFESIDVNLPRDHKERVSVEQHCLARDIVNLIACEGIERVERHEPLGKWRSRFMMAGFRPYRLSSFVNATIKGLLESYSPKYTLEERDDTVLLGWMSRPLVASCAWR